MESLDHSHVAQSEYRTSLEHKDCTTKSLSGVVEYVQLVLAAQHGLLRSIRWPIGDHLHSQSQLTDVVFDQELRACICPTE